MTDFEKGQNAIKTILKYGDLYDVIAKSGNAKDSSYPFFRAHLLLFSRILYSAFLAGEKIDSYFAKVEKVKEAQDEIRFLMGVNVDVIRGKSQLDIIHGFIFPTYNRISFLYSDNQVFMDEYIANLQKILSFSIIHKTEYIFLALNDLNRLFINLDLRYYSSIHLNCLFNKGERICENENDDYYLILTQEDLQRLISTLLGYKIDKNFITHLGRRIDDPAIEMALDKFIRSNNLKEFKDTLVSRLCLNINSDSSYKTKAGGKASDTVSISDEYIKVISTSEGGIESPKTSVMFLCEYLGYPNYEALINSIRHLDDDKDRILMAILHLYINKREKIVIGSSRNNYTLFDRIYACYLKIKENKKSPRIYRYPKKSIKMVSNFFSMTLALYLTAVAFIAVNAGLFSIDFFRNNFLKNDDEDSDIAHSFTDIITMPYKYSWNLEKELIQSITGEFTNRRIELSNGITSTVRESFLGFGLGNINDKMVGRVIPLDGDSYFHLPEYYAAEYGASSTYHKGDITYDLKKQTVDYEQMQPLDSFLKVEVYFSKKELREMIKDNTITIPMALYPLDKNYILTKIVIYDQKDYKSIELDVDRTSIHGGCLSDDEVDILKSMKYPAIEFYYGINYSYYNSFVRNIEKNGSYLETDEEQMHDVITKALGLPSYASYEEIYEAIKSKKYSLDPFGDSNVKANTKKMDEKEFMGTIASMDYLICNLAATLAVEANQELTYVVGFTSDDDVITYGEAHAWAVSPSGEIVEVTPTDIDEEEESIITDVFHWAMQNNLSIIIALSLTSMIIYKLLGKKIIFNIKVADLKHLLNNSEMPNAYSYLNETRFGGINLPKNHTPLDYLNMLDEGFEGYTKKELQELLKMLKEGQNSSKPLAIKVVKRVPFIKQNSGKITRKLTKKEK